MIGHIFIIGQIGSFLDVKGVELVDVITAVQKQKDAERFLLHLDTPGGRVDIADNIYDYLESLSQPIDTIVEKECCSMGTKLFLIGEKRFAKKGSFNFMIHNPWLSEVSGDANELEKAATMIRAEEDNLMTFYSKKTGTSKEGLNALMDNETYLTPEQAKDLGFVTDIIEATKSPVAIKSKSKISNNPEKKNMETLSEKAVKALEATLALLKNKKIAVGAAAPTLTLTAADGTAIEITYADGVDDGMAEVGDGITPADGSFVMPDGSTITAVGGKVTEVTAAQASADPDAAALAAENIALKAQLAERDKKDAALAAKMDIIEKSLKAMGSAYVPAARSTEFVKKEEKKEEVNRFAHQTKKPEKK